MNTPSASSGVSTPKIKYRVVRSKGREILPLEIYHNVSLRAPLKRAERDSAANTAKRDVFPGVNRKNASGSLSAHCIAMHESEWRSVWAHTVPMRHIFGHFQFVNP